jgi:hypothetical protein
MTTFLWTGSDMVQCGKSLVTWDRVQWGGARPQVAQHCAVNMLALAPAHGLDRSSHGRGQDNNCFFQCFCAV